MAEVAAKYLSGSNVVIYNSPSFLYNALNSKQAVAYMRGTDKNAGGHAWVADAAKQLAAKIDYYEYDVLQWSKVGIFRYIYTIIGAGAVLATALHWTACLTHQKPTAKNQADNTTSALGSDFSRSANKKFNKSVVRLSDYPYIRASLTINKHNYEKT